MGKRLQKIINGEACELARWTDSCSGCTETVDGHNVFEYPIDPKHGCFVGAGCPECGYTGKRRREFWVPMAEDDA
jgi:hypothetical protein